MRPFIKPLAWLFFVGLVVAAHAVFSAPEDPRTKDIAAPTEQVNATLAGHDMSTHAQATTTLNKFSRLQVLIGSLTVFTLAVIIGFEVIAKVPPTLHTPLMSGSNAISGITVVGALIAAGNQQTGIATFFGLIAVILANINVVGGFWVTHRMLMMFKKK
ncbi:MAG: NAD(P) transhydrogenase subunit alpha [Pirellulaceae bacterium]|nr:NAD(P) transhydrogenase subunit alpha [Pirellulaceae bacterium]